MKIELECINILGYDQDLGSEDVRTRVGDIKSIPTKRIVISVESVNMEYFKREHKRIE